MQDVKKLIECLYDSMTECIYQHPITSFTVETKPQPVFEVDILGKGRAALEAANDELGETFLIIRFSLHYSSSDSSLLLLLLLSLAPCWAPCRVTFLLFTLPFSLADICEYTVSAAGGNNVT